MPMARSYRQMRDTPRTRQRVVGRDEGGRRPGQTAGAKLRISMEQALKQRQQRRAYDGAPPTIPHLVQQNSASECMACHAKDCVLGRARGQNHSSRRSDQLQSVPRARNRASSRSKRDSARSAQSCAQLLLGPGASQSRTAGLEYCSPQDAPQQLYAGKLRQLPRT